MFLFFLLSLLFLSMTSRRTHFSARPSLSPSRWGNRKSRPRSRAPPGPRIISPSARSKRGYGGESHCRYRRLRPETQTRLAQQLPLAVPLQAERRVCVRGAGIYCSIQRTRFQAPGLLSRAAPASLPPSVCFTAPRLRRCGAPSRSRVRDAHGGRENVTRLAAGGPVPWL